MVVSESIAIWSSDGNQSKLMNLDPETSLFAKLIFLNIPDLVVTGQVHRLNF